MHTRIRQCVDSAVEQLFEILIEPHDIQQRTSGSMSTKRSKSLSARSSPPGRTE